MFKLFIFIFCLFVADHFEFLGEMIMIFFTLFVMLIPLLPDNKNPS